MRSRTRIALILACLAALALAAAPAQAHHPAQGNFGLNLFKVAFTDAEGEPVEQAGAHPFAMTVGFGGNFDSELIPEGWLKDVFIEQISGLVGDTTAYKRCSTIEFLQLAGLINSCSLDTQVGINATSVNTAGAWFSAPVFNLEPPPGVLLRLGFRALVENVVVDVSLDEEPPHNPIASSRNIPQLGEIFANKLQLWGNPSDPRHDDLRGQCGSTQASGLMPYGDPESFSFLGDAECGEEEGSITANPRPFLTLPTTCAQPLLTHYEAFAWGPNPLDDGFDEGGDLTGPFRGCDALGLKPSITAQPTSRSAQSPSGLDFTLGVDDPGLASLDGLAQSDIRKTVVTLPEGMTANPSLAEGLAVCSEDDLGRETLAAAPGEGCPQASKIGTAEAESPLVGEAVKGTLFVATPRENLAGDSLIALYLVFKNPKLGIIIKQPLKVTPDPRTGQLLTTAEDIPQLPFSQFRLHFREGGRSPLVTPPSCGPHRVKAMIYPWAGGPPVESTSTFQIDSGPGGGPCPAGTPPFDPGFEAGSANNAAGAASPFSMRLTRRDGDQDLTRFDATLPPGVGAILAGVDRCPEAQIALAKAKTGKAELRSPSCPANSKIGTVKAGAGVGSQLTYVPGSIYLAGPFGGAPISAVAIVPAVAGPFDVGTVVYRQALEIDPSTGEVTADGARSDPLPHILAGIPVVVRDVQVHIDRPGFTYDPTSCDPFATTAAIWGGGSQLFSSLDDSPVARQARYQAAGCQGLGFKPSLSLRLRGGTRRGAFPALHLLYRPRSGDANLKRLSLRFPHSEFIEQGHFRTICTRVQFAAGAGHGSQCPKGSVYGHVRVYTPILSEALEGPVYLRSSSHKLPDVVLALHGPPSLPIDLEVATRIDSVHGGLRAIAQGTPDAPVTKAVVDMQGGQKGLFVNSTELCLAKHRANAGLEGQNAKTLALRPLVRARCGGRTGRRG